MRKHVQDELEHVQFIRKHARGIWDHVRGMHVSGVRVTCAGTGTLFTSI